MLWARWGTNMSHFGNQERGWLTSSRIASVYHMWRCKKCIWKLFQIITLPWHPSTRHQTMYRIFSKYTRKWRSSLRGGWGYFTDPLSHAVLLLSVGMTVPRGHILSALWSPIPLSQPISILWSPPCHVVCVRLYRHSTRGVERFSNHSLVRQITIVYVQHALTQSDRCWYRWNNYNMNFR